MLKTNFLGFFVKYIFKAKTRQGLLLMAMAGLMLSSFSLLVVQSALKGLQNNRLNRAKGVSGHYTITVDPGKTHQEQLISWLENNSKRFTKEIEIEGLLRNQGHIVPVIIHGVSPDHYLPEFLPKKILKQEILFSSFLAHKLHAYLDDQIQFISPSHTDTFFGDLPRHKSVLIKKYINTNEPDIDEFHAWTHIRNTQSILRKKVFNRVRVYDPLSLQEIKELEKTNVTIKSWEELNSTLVYALAMENNVTLFLFMTTVILVVLTIASGLSIFYSRIKQDFASFWILGMSLDKIKKMSSINITIITISSLFIGNLLALGFLMLLKKYSPAVMPKMFVDRSLPILISFDSFVFSLIIPAVVTIIFSYLSNSRFFGKKEDFLQLIRSVGR